MSDGRDMKLTYRIISESGERSTNKEVTIGNLYSFPKANRKRKAQGCAARSNCCSLYSIEVVS